MPMPALVDTNVWFPILLGRHAHFPNCSKRINSLDFTDPPGFIWGFSAIGSAVFLWWTRIQTKPWRKLVEVRGVEPLSWWPSARASTCLSGHLI